MENYFDYIGVDPGGSGGLCCISGGGVETQSLKDLALMDQWNWIVMCPAEVKCRAAIERVSGYIGEDQPGSRMFDFGASFGALRAFLIAAAIPFEEVTPQTWQRDLGISFRNKKGGETKSQHKARIRQFAQNLFPRLKVTLATADAILIAEWCRRKHSVS